MKLQALRKLMNSKGVVKLLFDLKNTDKWESNQKWIVSDYLWINRDSLDIFSGSSNLTNGNMTTKTEWITMVKSRRLTRDKDKIVKLLNFYKSILNFIERNGEEDVFNYLISRGLPNRLNSLHFIDMNEDIPIVRNLSEDQSKFIESILNGTENNHLLIAGPGSGKTTTLSHLVRELIDRDKRVLVLMYNRNVRDDMIRLLKQCGISKVIKNIMPKHLDNQVLVTTMHKYASMFVKYGTSGIDYDQLFRKIIPSKLKEIHWDYCIVDEAHDIQPDQLNFLIDKIPKNKLIFAGDFMQTLYSSNDSMLQNIIGKIESVHCLSYNYRSSGNIVNILNKLPKVCPYKEQTAIYEDMHDVILDKSKDYPTSVLKYLRDFKPGETFIIFPMTIKYHGMDESIENILKYISSEDPERFRRIHRYKPIGIDGIMRNDTDYILTSKGCKGLERKQVIIFGTEDLDQNLYETALRHIFVGMSRALERLVIVTRGNEISENSPLNHIISDCTVVSSDQPLNLKESLDSSQSIENVHDYIDHSYLMSERYELLYTGNSEYYSSDISHPVQTIKIYPERSDNMDEFAVSIDVPFISSLSIQNSVPSKKDTMTISHNGSEIETDQRIVHKPEYIPLLLHLSDVVYLSKDYTQVFKKDDSMKYIARAAYFLNKSERMKKLGVNYRDIYIPKNIRYILSVDDEYRIFRNHTVYYEKALTVYDLKTNKIVDSANLVHRNAEINREVSVVSERETCHRFCNKYLETDTRMDSDYLNLIGRWDPEDSLIIHWSGMEGKNYDFTKSLHPAVKGKKYQCLDVRKIYESYILHYRSIYSVEERYSSLDDAIKDIFGESMNSLLYHRAHEDTIACLLVLLQLIDH